MSTPQFQQSFKWFNEQVERYEELADLDAPLVRRKQRHTLRVLDHARQILKESGTSLELRGAIEVAVLLHDVGRFPQIVHRKTYDDQVGGNHAEAGANIIEETDLLDDFSPAMRDVILDAVRFHNRAVLPDTLSPDSLRALEVLRDADKLDAIRNNLKYLNPKAQHGKVLKSGLTWHETEVSSEAIDLVMTRKLIPFKDINWSNDYILFLCCWIYDLHFTYAFSFLEESGNYEELLGKLPDQSPLAEAKAQLRDDLKWIAARSRS